MVKFDKTGFGWIVVNGEKYRHDVIVFPDGKVERRSGGFWIFGRHTIRREELEELRMRGSGIIVSSTGTSNKAS